MTTKDLALLRSELIHDEGTGPVRNGRFFPYTCPAGKLTIAHGRNLEDTGISVTTALQMLDEDIDACLTDLRSFTWFSELDGTRQRVLVNMRFNLGPGGFRGFSRMLAAVARHDYEAAAVEMALSKWAEQTKGRAVRLVRMMRTGTDQ